MGDLREEYARQVRRSGAARATRWHLRQSAGIAMRYGVARLLRRKPPVRWIAIAEHDTDGRWWTGLTRDALYAWRSVAQRPALSVVVVVTLAVALAANSTTYSLLDAFVLRPYRFAGVDRLMVVTTMAPDDTFVDRENVSAADLREWSARDIRGAVVDVPVVGREPVGSGYSRRRGRLLRVARLLLAAGVAAGARPRVSR